MSAIEKTVEDSLSFYERKNITEDPVSNSLEEASLSGSFEREFESDRRIFGRFSDNLVSINTKKFDRSVPTEGIKQESQNFSPSFIRTKNRALTAKNFLHQEESLLQERNILIDKKYSEGLSVKEKSRLKYIGWQLDRIEDAQIGDNLDFLEHLVEQKEILGDRIAEFSNQVEESLKRRKKKRRKYGSR